MTDNRPVNLADVLGEITRANEYGDINDGPFVELENALRALPTFDPIEARRRLTGGEVDRWQAASTNGQAAGDPPDKDAPGGYEPVGAWQPFASADSWTDWRRPLRRVTS